MQRVAAHFGEGAAPTDNSGQCDASVHTTDGRSTLEIDLIAHRDRRGRSIRQGSQQIWTDGARGGIHTRAVQINNLAATGRGDAVHVERGIRRDGDRVVSGQRQAGACSGRIRRDGDAGGRVDCRDGGIRRNVRSIHHLADIQATGAFHGDRGIGVGGGGIGEATRARDTESTSIAKTKNSAKDGHRARESGVIACQRKCAWAHFGETVACGVIDGAVDGNRPVSTDYRALRAKRERAAHRQARKIGAAIVHGGSEDGRVDRRSDNVAGNGRGAVEHQISRQTGHAIEVQRSERVCVDRKSGIGRGATAGGLLREGDAAGADRGDVGAGLDVGTRDIHAGLEPHGVAHGHALAGIGRGARHRQTREVVAQIVGATHGGIRTQSERSRAVDRADDGSGLNASATDHGTDFQACGIRDNCSGAVGGGRTKSKRSETGRGDGGGARGERSWRGHLHKAGICREIAREGPRGRAQDECAVAGLGQSVAAIAHTADKVHDRRVRSQRDACTADGGGTDHPDPSGSELVLHRGRGASAEIQRGHRGIDV